MLDGLDEVDWAGLSHAYGAADDVPALLRQAASDGDAAGEAISELYGSVFHQGTVYPATVAAVPFLAELARSAPTRRADFAWMLGMMGDRHQAYGTAFDRVRAAVAAQADRLIPLLVDADAQVRVAAAYAVAQCGGPPAPLWARWAVEEQVEVRASLLLALGQLDPDGSAAVVADAVVHAEPVVRVAAALALVRTGAAWPDGSVARVVTAIEDGADVEYAWQRHADWTDELLVDTGDGLATALLTQLVTASSPDTRRMAIWAMTIRGQARRSAPALLLPIVRPLLDDPDEGVHDEVIGAFRRCGAVCGRFVDDVARVAMRYPDAAGLDAITPARKAMETLMLLGDPRWIELICAAAANGHDVGRLSLREDVPHSPDMLDSVRGRLAELAGLASPHPAIAVLAAVLGGWGPAAAPAVPQLLAVLPHAGDAVSQALLRIGQPSQTTVPYLRAIVAQTGDLEAAVGVWRLTHDAQPLIDALQALLVQDRAWLPRGAHTAAEAGSALLPLVPAIRAHLTGAAAPTYPQRDMQVFAARLMWTATGDPTLALPTLHAVLSAGHTPARRAADLVADLAATHAEDLAGFAAALRDQLADRWSRVPAARALWRLGTPPADLVAPLIAAIEDGHGSGEAPALLLDMGAVQAIGDLDRLAERDERISTTGIDDDIVWQDETLQLQLRTVATALREAR